MQELLRIMEKLRRECPWDAKQTHETLKPYLIEESYEVLESIDKQAWEDLAGELGDVLLQVIFHSEIAAESGRFDFETVVGKIKTKLIERHPHVFGDKRIHSAEDVQNNWEHNKVKSEQRHSLLSGIPAEAPALLRAQRLQEKAATVGFDWNDMKPIMDKLDEEWQELREAVETDKYDHIKEELGDLLFTVVNLSRYLNVNAEDALRLTNSKFINRFRYIEKQYKGDLNKIKRATLEELDAKWEEAKDKI